MKGTPSAYQHLQDVFGVVDQMDANRFGSFFSPQGKFIFGNAPAAIGPPAISEMVDQFFSAIHGIQHLNLEIQKAGDLFLVTGEARYTRHDGSVLQVPFANTIALDQENCITDYQIYIDNSQLFQ